MAARYASDRWFRTPSLDWPAACRLAICLAVFALFMTVSVSGRAHSGGHLQQTAANTSQSGDQAIVVAARSNLVHAIAAAPSDRTQQNDPSSDCSRGPLHASCAAGGACCVAPGDQGFDLVPDGAARASFRLTDHVSGLPPSPLDRPPR